MHFFADWNVLGENSKKVTTRDPWARVYRRDGVMAQKVIEGDNDTCQHMYLILRWLKIRTIQFSYFLPDILVTCLFAKVAHFFLV